MKKTICPTKKTAITALSAVMLCAGLSSFVLPQAALAGQDDSIQVASVKDHFFIFISRLKAIHFRAMTLVKKKTIAAFSRMLRQLLVITAARMLTVLKRKMARIKISQSMEKQQ